MAHSKLSFASIARIVRPSARVPILSIRLTHLHSFFADTQVESINFLNTFTVMLFHHGVSVDETKKSYFLYINVNVLDSGVNAYVSPSPRTLLAGAFASQGCLGSLPPTGLQIERVPLNLLDDVVLKDLSLKALERALQALAIVKLNFSQGTHRSFPIAVASSA